MKISKLLAAISAVATFAGASQVTAQEMQPGIFMVPQGASQKIDRHGVCRTVKNTSGNPIMVPAGTPQQWSNGQGAFLNNISNMRGVSVASCMAPKDVGGCRGTGPAYFNCRGYFLDRVNHPSNPAVHWQIYHNVPAPLTLVQSNKPVIAELKDVLQETITMEDFCAAPGRKAGVYTAMIDVADLNNNYVTWFTCD